MKKPIILLFLTTLCLSCVSLIGCNDNEKPSTDIPNHSEEHSWSDENVDKDGWT